MILAWFLGIYGLADIFLGPLFEYFSLAGIDIGAWILLYPSLFILYKLFEEMWKNPKWQIASIAALDTLFIYGIVLVGFSGIINIEKVKLGFGFLKDWREFYAVGVGLLLWVARQREKYEYVLPYKEQTFLSKLASPAVFISGLYLISEATYGFIITKTILLLRFLLESLSGAFLCFMSYYLLYLMEKIKPKKS